MCYIIHISMAIKQNMLNGNELNLQFMVHAYDQF